MLTLKVMEMKKLNLILISLLALALVSCGGSPKEEKVATTFFNVPSAAFVPFVNQKKIPADVDLTRDITLLNRDYPIEIALYKNGEFFYDLPNLGSGRGTYKYKDGKIHLFAKRALFNMNIEIIASNEEATDFVLRFRDRFGVRVIPTEKMNLK